MLGIKSDPFVLLHLLSAVVSSLWCRQLPPLGGWDWSWCRVELLLIADSAPPK